MNPRYLPITSLVLGVIGLAASADAAWAGPDAGAQIRRFQDETLRRIVPPSGEQAPAPKAPSRAQQAASASAERIHVAGFSVHGVTQFSVAEVAASLQPFVGKDLDTAGIHAAADALNQLYRRAGYFVAKVFVPPQPVGDVIRLDVYEGYLDAVGIELVNQGVRVESHVVRGILEANLPRDKPIHRAAYERALLIAEDLPGVTTASTLYPGEEVGTARLRTTLTDLPAFAGNIDLDNFGVESTGRVRLGTTLYLNSPGKVGDQLVGRFVTSGHRSNYAYLTYLRPILPSGTRLGASVDYIAYHSSPINNVGNAEGLASDLRFYLTHPIIRSRHGNLNLRTDISLLRMDDSNDLQINPKRNVRTFNLALHGDDDHVWLGVGQSLFDLSVTAGSVDVDGNDTYLAIDRATMQTDGRFARANVTVSRLQQLSTHWSLFTRIKGQLASGNLDTSQKFYLGGGTSMSGYPTGEAGADQGLELNAELRHDFVAPWGGTLMGGVFYQQGWLEMHKSPWNGWQGTNALIKNRFTLSSLGFGVTQTLAGAWVLRGVIGWQLGENPLRDPMTGVASDGDKDRYRAWFQVVRYF